MSRVYFHSLIGTAELRGSERAYGGRLVNDALMSSIGVGRHPPYGDEWEWLRPFLSDYMGDGRELTPFAVEAGMATMHNDTPIEIAGYEPHDRWTIALNTALVTGSDPIKLLARIHGQCEIHAYVEGPNREWLADIIDDGRRSMVLRREQGWESVAGLLRSTDTGPVVMSYSVCDSFPNPAGIDPPEGEEYGEWFYELPDEEQWMMAMQKLREVGAGHSLEMRPDNWDDYYFCGGLNGFQMRAACYESRAERAAP